MEKNLDGIKKLNPEEIKRNRKIVLGYIGEKDPEIDKARKAEGRTVSAFNKVDGIKLNRISSLKLKAKDILEKPAPAIDNQADKQVKIKQEELVKKEIAEKARLEAEEKAKAEEDRKWREKLRLEEKEREEKRIIKENERLKKIKRAEEIKKIKQEVKLAKMGAAEKKKLKRRKAIKFFKKNLNNKLRGFFSVVRRNFVYITLYLIVFLIIGYLVFCLLVLRLKIDNNIILGITRILPVPAVVTSQGIINYNDFRDIKNNNYAGLNSVEKKSSLAKWVILKNLSIKYGLPINSFSEVLALAFAKDEDFNQIGLSRIKRIGELLKNVDDIEQLSKYADESSDVIYYNSEDAAEKFGPTVFNLNVNQISDIVFSGSGYYIVQIVDDKNGQLGIKYLFVRAKTLDQYFSEKLSNIKIFILAN